MSPPNTSAGLGGAAGQTGTENQSGSQGQHQHVQDGGERVDESAYTGRAFSLRFIKWPGSDPDKKRFLDMIVVGGLEGKFDGEMNRALTLAKSIVKLETRSDGLSNYYLWLRMVEPVIRVFASKRIDGLLKGTVEGSIEAYQRYYGYPAHLPSSLSAALLEPELAEQIRNDEDIHVGSLLMMTLSAQAMSSLMNSQTNTGSGVALWHAIHQRFVPQGAAARHMLQTMMLTYNPGSKTVDNIISDLRGLFEHWSHTVNTPLPESDKIDTLLRHLPAYMQAFKIMMFERVEDGVLNTFDDVARRALRHEQQRISDEYQSSWQSNLPSTFGQQAPQRPLLGIGYHSTALPNPFGGSMTFGQGNQRQQRQPSQSSQSSQSPDTSADSGASGSTPGTSPSSDKGPPLCYHCRKRGHISANCPDRLAGRPPAPNPRDGAAQAGETAAHTTQHEGASPSVTSMNDFWASRVEEQPHQDHFAGSARHFVGPADHFAGSARHSAGSARLSSVSEHAARNANGADLH